VSPSATTSIRSRVRYRENSDSRLDTNAVKQRVHPLDRTTDLALRHDVQQPALGQRPQMPVQRGLGNVRQPFEQVARGQLDTRDRPQDPDPDLWEGAADEPDCKPDSVPVTLSGGRRRPSI
jgi:hypothetical protein